MLSLLASQNSSICSSGVDDQNAVCLGDLGLCTSVQPASRKKPRKRNQVSAKKLVSARKSGCTRMTACGCEPALRLASTLGSPPQTAYKCQWRIPLSQLCLWSWVSSKVLSMFLEGSTSLKENGHLMSKTTKFSKMSLFSFHFLEPPIVQSRMHRAKNA